MQVEGHLSSINFSSGIPESDVLKDEVLFPDFYTLVTDPFLLSLVTIKNDDKGFSIAIRR